MAIEVKVPSVGESVAEGILTSWAVADGAYVEKGQTLFELETDKASTDVPAPESGIVKHGVEAGAEVQIGAVVGTIYPDGKPDGAATAKAKHPAQEPSGEPAEDDEPREEREEREERDHRGVPATSVARKIAEENRIDLSSVPGTGPGGRVTREDVEQVIASLSGDNVSAERGAQFKSFDTIQRLPMVPLSSMSPAEADKQRAAAASKPKAQSPAPAPEPPKPTAPEADVTREKMSMLRRSIAARLVEAQHNAAMLTTFNDVDMSAVMALRKEYKDAFKEKHGVGLGFMSFFVAACVRALRDYPRVNAMVDGNEIVQHHRQHHGVAVSTPKGLVVPVLRDAGSLSFAAIEKGIVELATKARDGKLDLADMQGGTFTITNGGVFGSMLSTPILNPPQSAILGMHRIEDRPVARGGQVVIRPMMYLALSYDHRIVDGREAVGFLVRVKECIEEPARLLLEV